MADNFNLRSFLSENKLTKNAQLLREVSDYGFDDLMDAVDDLYVPGTPEHTELSRAVEEAIHNNEIDMSEFGDNLSAPSQAVERIAGEIGLDETTEDMHKEAYTPKSKLEQVIQKAWAETDLEKAKQLVRDLIEPSKVKSKDTILQTIKGIGNKAKLDQYLANSLLKFEKLGLHETATTMTTKEKELVKMVQEALGMEGYGDDNVNLKRDKQGLPPQQGPTYSEGEETTDETVIPEYNTIEELMKQIDKGTNRVAEEHKVLEMKKIAKALRGEAQRMEESEHAKHINPKVRKKYLQDAIKIEKAAEKLVAALEKEAKNTKPAAAPKKEEAPVTLAEIKRKRLLKSRILSENRLSLEKRNTNTNTMENFDLKKFLVENKITTNSKLIKESLNENEMKSFVKVETGSRGEVEDIETVDITYESIQDEYNDIYANLSNDNDDLSYLEEFSSIDINKEKGIVMYGFSEEDTTYYIDSTKNQNLCAKLLKGWDGDDMLLDDAIEDMFKVIG